MMMLSFTCVDDEGFLVAIYICLLSVKETKTRATVDVSGENLRRHKVILSRTVTKQRRSF
jgi:hypothetical protein